MLLRFRVFNIGLVADIEKAFLQVVLHPDDRDLVRFLWFKHFDPLKPFEEQELVEYRLGRVLFGVSSSPFLLEGTLIVHSEKYAVHDPQLVRKLVDCLHVDDLVSGCDSVVDGEEFFMKCKECLSDASFNLKKFQSNNLELESLVYKNTGDDKNLIETQNPDDNKVLGVR